MKIFRRLFVVVCVVLAFSGYSVKGQGCPTPTVDCPTLNDETFEPVLSLRLAQSTGDQTANVNITILDFTVVCETVGTRRGRALGASVLVRFDCTTNIPSACPSSSNTSGLQYDARCLGQDNWNLGTSTFAIESGVGFGDSTMFCGLCLRQFAPTSPDSHCSASTVCADNCTAGLRQCTSAAEDSCCNFYYDDDGDRTNDVCCSECPEGFLPDANFDCGCPLLELENGQVTYSDPRTTVAHYINTVATFSCNPGFSIVNDISRTCQPDTAWDGDNSTACVPNQCPSLNDPANGRVTVVGTDVGSTANYSCDAGYYLDGDELRTCENSGSWSSDDPTCEVDCPACLNGGSCNLATDVAECVCAVGFTGADCGDIQCPACLNGGTCDFTTGICVCPPSYYGPTCSELCGEKLTDCANCTAPQDDPDNPVCTACKEGFELDQDTKECKQNGGETGKSSCGTGCIVGIIIALLALLIAGIVALVIFGLYKYLHNPATKLAKTDTEGLNGVARDNPLYLEPATVVDEAPEVAAPLATAEA